MEGDNLPTNPANIELDLLSRLLASTELRDQAIEEVPEGMEEAPGSDVQAEEKVLPLPLPPIVEEEGSAEAANLTVPPIGQQPSSPTTPVTVEVVFPSPQ